MYAPEKDGIAHPHSVVGIIAGNGDLPDRLAARLTEQGFVPVIARLGGDFGVGQAGAIISYFKKMNVHDLVMVGGLQRPNWLTLKVDLAGLRIVSKFLFRKLGDDGLLRAVRGALESEGFRVQGVHRYMPELLAPFGQLGSVCAPLDVAAWDREVAAGLGAAKAHGARDLGQSVVFLDGHVFDLEDRGGTNALMRRAASARGRKILFKAAKPQQDLDLDLPTIGRRTIDTAIECGFSGIVVEAGRTLFLDRDYVIAQADRHGIFVFGCQLNEAGDA